jgi:transposase
MKISPLFQQPVKPRATSLSCGTTSQLAEKRLCAKAMRFHRQIVDVVSMRGIDIEQGVVFSSINPEERVKKDHPLRAIRSMMNWSLRELSSYFDTLSSAVGRDSIPPERRLRALRLQVLFSIGSGRPRMEPLDYDLLYRWFVGLSPDEQVWDVTVYTKKRDRLIEGAVSERLLASVVEPAREANRLSEDHVTVDGTLIEAWANRRSFQPGDPEKVVGTGARGKKLLGDKVESTTDPEARWYRKGGPAGTKPSSLAHALIENRNGLVVGACGTQSSRTAEAEAALTLVDTMKRAKQAKITLGADTAYQTQDFVEGLRERKVAPHVAESKPNPKFPNFLTPEERADAGFGISQSKRKLVEKVFGWGKQGRTVKQIKLRGLARVDGMIQFVMAGHNLVKMVKLIPTAIPVPVQ